MQMQNSKVLKVILAIGGLAYLIPGLLAFFSPVTFTEGNDIDLGSNASLFNDYRSLGGILIGTGVLMLVGIIHARMTFTAIVVEAVAYTTFTLGRVYSIIVDGTPASGLVSATIIEAIIAALAIYALVTYTEKPVAVHTEPQLA